MVIKITANVTANIGASNIKTEPESAQVWDKPAQEPVGAGVEKRLANLDAAMAAPGDPVPLPTRRAVQTANDDGANLIKPLAFVNLRQKPTRSAPAIGVVEKGVKLRVVGRKNRWVRVTNPATSEMGWIYTGNVTTVR
jgi:uncharacterized protein YgiM (DUF1202 family)